MVRAAAIAFAAALAAALAQAIVGCQSRPGPPPPVVDSAGIDEAAAARRALAEDLALRYGRAASATRQIAEHAFEAAEDVAVDPLLVLAVIGVESRFDPGAANPSGAKGLMQVIPRYHLRKLAAHGGEQSVLDPGVNVRVGTAILAEYIERAGGEAAGLQRYVGANGADGVYARKVLAERARLRAMLGERIARLRGARG
jgi:soluble lytic murein transglycosylase-like protein